MAPSRDKNDGFSRLQEKQAALQAIVQVMAGSVQLDVLPVFEEALAQVTAALKAPMAAIHLLGGEEEDKLTLVHQRGLDPVWSLAWANLTLDGGAPPAKVYTDGKGLELAGPEAPQGLDAVVVAPVRGADIGLGALSVLWSGGDGFRPDSVRLPFLETVGHLLGLAIEHAGLVSELVDSVNELRQLKAKEEQRSQELAELNQRLYEANIKLEELSITDELTGLYNRRHFTQRLDEEILRSQRQRHPVSLVMADLDHFKRINDTLGHQIGDEALKQFADWLKNGVRRVDTVGRYGGEEFVIVLVDCGPARALKVADKLRREVARRSQIPPFDKLGGFTVSMGVTSLIAGDGTQDLIQRADQALYAAKEKGRNTVVAA